MPIIISNCCCDDDCCECRVTASADEFWDPTQVPCGCEPWDQWFDILCPGREMILFSPTGCGGAPIPNPGPAFQTTACYRWADTDTVIIEVPNEFECGGQEYYFHHWLLGPACEGFGDVCDPNNTDCVRIPYNDWEPFVGCDPATYGCSYSNRIIVRLCDPAAGDCNVRLCARWIDFPGTCECQCDCFGCYTGGWRGRDPQCDIGLLRDYCLETLCDNEPCPP